MQNQTHVEVQKRDECNLQRAVNRQPWLPRGRLVETSVTHDAHNHKDCDIPLKKWHHIQDAKWNLHLYYTPRILNSDMCKNKTHAHAEHNKKTFQITTAFCVCTKNLHNRIQPA